MGTVQVWMAAEAYGSSEPEARDPQFKIPKSDTHRKEVEVSGSR